MRGAVWPSALTGGEIKPFSVSVYHWGQQQWGRFLVGAVLDRGGESPMSSPQPHAKIPKYLTLIISLFLSLTSL